LLILGFFTATFVLKVKAETNITKTYEILPVLPDTIYDDSTSFFNNGDTVSVIDDGAGVTYILYEDSTTLDSLNLNKTLLFPTPDILIEILDKSLPVNSNQFGINITDMFEPGKANSDDLGDYSPSQPDPWTLLSQLRPEILRFPTGSGSKYMHLLGSDNPDGTRNGGYGFDILEIINFYDYTDNVKDVDGPAPGDPPLATILSNLQTDYDFDGVLECADCDDWMNGGDVSTFVDYYSKWAEQPIYDPTGLDREDEPLYINELIRLVDRIETDNPGHVVNVVVCLNIMSETAADAKEITDYLQYTNTWHPVKVAGVELGNECYFQYFERTLGFAYVGDKSPFDHYWDYINGGNYSTTDGFDAGETSYLFARLPAYMETTGAHDYISALKGDPIHDIQLGIPVANLPICADTPFFSDPDEGDETVSGGALPEGCYVNPWNTEIVAHYGDMITPVGGSPRHKFDAVILHPYYTPKNHPLAAINENWFYAPMCIDGNPATPVVFDGDNVPPGDSGMDQITSGQYTYGATPDSRIQLAFTRFAGLGNYNGNIKTLMDTRFKAAYDEHAEILQFMDADEGPNNKKLWTTEYNILPKDESPDATEFGAKLRLDVYTQSLVHASLMQEWFMRNLKMNYDQDYINNFFTISTVQSFLGGNSIDLISFANEQDELELGLMATCASEYLDKYLVRRTLYHEFMMLKNIYQNNMEYIKTETSMYSLNFNVQPTLFYDESHDAVVVYYSNNKDVEQRYAIDLGDLAEITGYPVNFDESAGITITHINPLNLYSNSGKSALWELNSASDTPPDCVTLGTINNRFEIKQITTSTDPAGGCPGAFTSGICVYVPASSVGYFTIPLIELRRGELQGAVKLYPNPTSTSFYFLLENFGLEYGKLYDVKILDLNGIIIYDNPTNEGDKINIENFPNGLYKVIVSDSGKILSTGSLVKIQ